MTTTWKFYTQRPRPTGSVGGIISGEGDVVSYEAAGESIKPVVQKFKELWSCVFISEHVPRIYTFADDEHTFEMSQGRSFTAASVGATSSFHWMATGLMHPEGD